MINPPWRLDLLAYRKCRRNPRRAVRARRESAQTVAGLQLWNARFDVV